MIDLSPWKPFGELTREDMARMSAIQFRERYPEEYALRDQVCVKCGRRGLHSCPAQDGTRDARPFRIDVGGVYGSARMFMDDGSVWDLIGGDLVGATVTREMSRDEAIALIEAQALQLAKQHDAKDYRWKRSGEWNA